MLNIYVIVYDYIHVLLVVLPLIPCSNNTSGIGGSASPLVALKSIVAGILYSYIQLYTHT